MDLFVDDSVGGLVESDDVVEPDKIIKPVESDVPVDNIVIDVKPVKNNKPNFWFLFVWFLTFIVLVSFIILCYWGIIGGG
jgi:hypothetical protein